jgi:hypothetical protein
MVTGTDGSLCWTCSPTILMCWGLASDSQERGSATLRRWRQRQCRSSAAFAPPRPSFYARGEEGPLKIDRVESTQTKFEEIGDRLTFPLFTESPHLESYGSLSTDLPRPCRGHRHPLFRPASPCPPWRATPARRAGCTSPSAPFRRHPQVTFCSQSTTVICHGTPN